MRIWDTHCHIPSNRIPGKGLYEQTANLVKIAQRVGIERLCLFIATDASEEKNAEIEKTLEDFSSQVLGYVSCSPRTHGVQKSIDKINRWIRDGPMVGVKWTGGSGICSEAEYEPFFARAVELTPVIYIHTWIKLGGTPPRPGGGMFVGESTPWDVVNLARRFPEHPFICGHNGGDWELGTRIIRPHKNLYLEVCGGYPNDGQVEMAVREVPVERIIYGSDITGRSFATQLARVWGAAIPDDQKEMIFSGNFIRLARPILEKKGYAV